MGNLIYFVCVGRNSSRLPFFIVRIGHELLFEKCNKMICGIKGSIKVSFVIVDFRHILSGHARVSYSVNTMSNSVAFLSDSSKIIVVI